MKKYFIALGLALALVASPAVAGAQALSIDQLLSLISTLQAQIAALTAQLNQVQGGNSGSGGGVSSSISGSTGSGCVVITRPLYRGISDNESGGEVSSLQRFLRSQGVYNDDITGFYGPATEAGVKRFQASQAIVSSGDGASTGYGLVGGLTRARIRVIGCVPPNPTPTPVPPLPTPIPVPIYNLTTEQILNSNGFVNGNYSNTCYPPTDGKCDSYFNQYLNKNIIFGQLDSDLVKEAVTIHTVCGASCGQQVAAFKLVNGKVLMVDLPNSLVSGAAQNIDSIKIRDDGVVVVSETDNSGSWTNYYRVNLVDGVLKAEKISLSSTNKPPVITGLTAPSGLRAGETGTWAVKAYDPEGGALSYNIDWGESLALGINSSSQSVTQTSTFTHSYSTVGSYKVTVTVSDSAGQSAQTSATVQVGSVVSSPLKFLAPVSGKEWFVGKTYNILWSGGDYFDKPYSLYLTPLDSSGVRFMGTSLITAGSFIWTIPTDVKPGNYLIQLSGPYTSGGESEIFSIASTISPQYKPVITRVSSKGGGDFEAYAGYDISIEGYYLGGNYISTTNVYLGGVKLSVNQASDSLIWASVPSSISSGIYDLYVSNEKGQSDSVKVKVYGVTTPTLKASLKVTVLDGGVRCFVAPCEFPLTKATVKLYDNSKELKLLSTQTTTNGYALFSNLNPGTYHVSAEASGFVWSDYLTVGLVSGQSAEVKTTLSPTTVSQVATDSQLAAVLQSLQSVLNSLSTGL